MWLIFDIRDPFVLENLWLVSDKISYRESCLDPWYIFFIISWRICVVVYC